MPDGCFEIRTVVPFIFTFALGGLGGCAGARAPNDYDPSEEPDAAIRADSGERADAGEGQGGGSDSPGLEPGEWQQLSFDARKQFMATKLMPAVTPLFQAFDAQRFAAVSCKTCHGSGAKAGTFALPSPDLPSLSSAMLMNPPEEQKPIIAFMRGMLKPKLMELLGLQDSAGLKCSTCHVMEP